MFWSLIVFRGHLTREPAFNRVTYFILQAYTGTGIHHHHHLFLIRGGRWGTTDDFGTSFLHFPPVLHCPLGLGELQACPFPDVVFPPFPLSALSSSPFHCALQDGFGQTWWTGDVIIPVQFASLYDGQEVFVWSDCLLDLGTDFLVGNMVFVWDANYLAVAPLLWGSRSMIQKHTEGWMWHWD